MPLSAAEKQRRYRERRKASKEKNEENKKKDRDRYHKNKVLVSEMSDRTKRRMRKKWRTAKAERKARNENCPPVPNTPPPSPDNSQEEESNKSRGRKKLRRDRSKLYRENLKLKAKIEKLKTKNEKYRKRAYRSKKLCSTQDNCQELTPSSKTKKIVKECLGNNVVSPGIEKIKRTLFKYHCMADSLKLKYKSAKRRNTKQTLKSVVASQLVKKYKLMAEIRKDCLDLDARPRPITRKDDKTALLFKTRKARMIHEFYLRDDVSRATAGKKETLTKNKNKMQRRYLLDSIKNLHIKFNKDVPINVSYALFCRHKPFYVIAPNVGSRDTCMCVIHYNMGNRFLALKKVQACEDNNLRDFIESLVCDVKSKMCMYSECKVCSNKPLTYKYSDVTKVQWSEWVRRAEEYQDKTGSGHKKKVKKVVKQELHGTLKTLKSKFEMGIKRFKKHMFNIKQQYSAYRTCIDNLQPHEAALHIDFSENYSCKLSTEVQGFHFGGSRKQVTLHTCVIYVKPESDNSKPQQNSFCSISSCHEHGPSGIWAHLSPVIEFIKTNHKSVTTLHIFSDGPTTQYRQKKNFYLFSKILFEEGFKFGTWSYFESSHGKGAADGIGGALKRTADRLVATGSDIKDVSDFFEKVQKETKMKLFLVTKEQVDRIEKTYPQFIPVLPGTMTLHQLIAKDPGKLYYRDVSCYCSSKEDRGSCSCFATKVYSTANEDNRLENEAAGHSSQSNKKVIRNVAKKPRLSYQDVYSSSEDSESLEQSVESPTILQKPNPADIRNGTYLLTELIGEKRNSKKYRYVAVAESSVEEGDVKVTFFKKFDNSCKKFILQENDNAFIKVNQVITILKNAPILKMTGNRMYYEFDHVIDLNE